MRHLHYWPYGRVVLGTILPTLSFDVAGRRFVAFIVFAPADARKSALHGHLERI
jgi:hypothetical protein